MDARIAWQSVAALGSDMSDPYCEPSILMGPPMVGSARNASFLERNPRRTFRTGVEYTVY